MGHCGRIIAALALALPLVAMGEGQPKPITPAAPAGPAMPLPDRDFHFPVSPPRLNALDGLIGDWQRRREWVLIPSGPSETAHKLTELAAVYARDCDTTVTTPLACGRADGYGKAAARLEAASSGSASECGKAGAVFRKAYATGTPSDDVARAYDLACLGSFSTRLSEVGTPVPSPRPPLLESAESAEGLLSAVGLLESGGAVRCAGLIRPDGKFYTVRHCLANAADGFTVRSVDGALLASGLQPVRQSPSSQTGVAADWAVFELPPGSRAVVRTNLVKLAAPAEVTLVAPYAHASATAYAQADAPGLRALRFPRDGLCQALRASTGCLQLVCQTVRGFSGAPIFSAHRPDGSYDVVGFVSGSGGEDQTCPGSENITNSTFATGADVFGG